MEWPDGGARRQFERFVASSTDELFRTGNLLTLDAADTEDLLQETYLRVARRWRRVRSMDHPVAYARRVLVNLAIKTADRRARRRQELESEDALGSACSFSGTRAVDRIDDIAQFRWALAQLTTRQRAVLVLRYWQSCTEAEAAELLGWPIGTVKSTGSRAVARLGELLAVDADSRSSRARGQRDPLDEIEKGAPC